ncbi:MAG TPA: SHOCT domain-containing protein [Candidatus Angelobacter sp.]|nr:SHOCT domain-containing protein [Candidatus Angelobacter sp.]
MGRPGLVGTVARTAVVAGTATAVSNNVSRRQYNRQMAKADEAAAQQDAAAAEQQAAAAAQQAQIDAQVQAALAAQAAQQQAAAAAAPAAAAPATSAVDVTAELQKLAALKEQGLIDDAEFSALKARVLGL